MLCSMKGFTCDMMTLLFFSSSSQVYHLGAMGNNFTLGEGFSMIPTYSLPSSMSNTMVILTTTMHFCISVFLINCPWLNNGICSPIKYVVYILYIIDRKEDMSGNGMARREKNVIFNNWTSLQLHFNLLSTPSLQSQLQNILDLFTLNGMPVRG